MPDDGVKFRDSPELRTLLRQQAPDSWIQLGRLYDADVWADPTVNPVLIEFRQSGRTTLRLPANHPYISGTRLEATAQLARAAHLNRRLK